MKKFISLFLSAAICFSGFAFAASAQSSADTVLVDNGKNIVMPIVISPDAPETDKTAAGRLSYYIGLMSGAKPEITDEASDEGIFIGKAAEQFVDLSGVTDEGYRIVAGENRLAIAGKGRRGTIYGVFEFLRRFCGCRWYAEDLIVTPPASVISVLADTDIAFNETFEYRETDWISPKDKEFSLANGLNSGVYRTLSDAQGGNVNYLGGFGHTLSTQFCSSSKYFETKPELFALHKGKRTGNQLCLSNEETYQIVLGEVLELLRTKCDPSDGLQIVSLTQNDNQEYCECAACKASDEKYGSHAGSMLLFINRIADAVKEAGYDNVGIDTFAYQYTRKTPVGIAPRDNVIVRLCSIECCFCHSLDDEKCRQNAEFMNDLRDWNKICSRLYIWDYTVNYSRSAVTFSDFGIIQRNMQIFAENGAKGVYEEGAYYASSVDVEFADLRAYLLSRLLSDPYMDYEAEMNGFLEAYYGDAAKYIREYLNILQRSESENDHMPIYDQVDDMYASLKNKDIKYIDSLWKSARLAAGTDYQKEKVLRSEISWLCWKSEAKKGEFSRLQLPSVWMNANKELYERLVDAGVTMLSEGSDRFIYDCENTDYVSASNPYFWKQSKLDNPDRLKEYTNKYKFYSFAEEHFGFILKPVFAILNAIASIF